MDDAFINDLILNKHQIKLPTNTVNIRSITQHTAKKMPERIYLYGSTMQILQHRVDAVIWCESMVSHMKARPNKYAISFEFSGCFMARYCIGSETHIAHIHCADLSNWNLDARFYWIKHITSYSKCTIFKPIDRYEVFGQSARNVECWGVISPKHRCFSLYVELIRIENPATYKLLCVIEQFPDANIKKDFNIYPYNEIKDVSKRRECQIRDLMNRWNEKFRNAMPKPSMYFVDESVKTELIWH